jgi:hypothetical protein
MPGITLTARTGTYSIKTASDKGDIRDSKKRKNSNERAGRTKRTASEGKFSGYLSLL